MTMQVGTSSQAPRALPLPARGGSDAETASADAQVAADPLRPTAADGWSPDVIRAVRSRNEGGFVGSAVNFTMGGVAEQPGQRLSVAQVDELAPFFATQFGLDEQYVRDELAKVYLYVGGPAVGGSAMTIGHHVYVPSEDSLTRMMTKPGRRWLIHELAHTMQFLAYHDGSPHTFLADYFRGMVVGNDPREPGSGGGPPVWGALFTGLRSAGKTEESLGAGATSLRDTVVSSVLPAAAAAVPVALIGGGALKAARTTTSLPWLGTGSAMATGLGVVAAPAIAGASIGAATSERPGLSAVLGGLAGGALAGGTLWRAGAFAAATGGGAGAGIGAATELGRTIARGGALGAAIGATVAGVAIGALAARASANTMRGWSSSADVLHELHNRTEGQAGPELGLMDAVHDAHWQEIDAEAIARQYVRGAWERPEPGTKVEGRVPTAPTGLDRIDADLGARADWGLTVPLIVGVPAALGVGAGVLGSRTGLTVLRSTIKEGNGPARAIGDAMRMLGSQSRGVANSFGIGAAVTVAPLVVGGIAGPIAFNLTGSETVARMTGAAAGATVAGGLLTMLLKGRGASALATTAKVGVGAAVAGALGLLAAGVATEALRPHERRYDAASS